MNAELESASEQWTDCAIQYARLGSTCPMYPVLGNHDYTGTTRTSVSNGYVPPSSFPAIAGVRTDGTIDDGIYGFLTIGGVQWLVIGLECFPRDACVQWADGVLKTYANYPTILLCHAFLSIWGNRYNWDASGADQPSSPVSYNWPGETNDGARLWSKSFSWNPDGLIYGNPNVRLVLSGHNQNNFTHRIDLLKNGKTCLQINSDYSVLLESPNTCLREIEFDYSNQRINVITFDSYTGKTIVRAASAFEQAYPQGNVIPSSPPLSIHSFSVPFAL